MARPSITRPALLALVTAAGLVGASAVALGVLPQQQGAVDLLTQANVTLAGAAADDQSGWSVAGAGDANGDGLADVIVGAPYADTSSGANAGSSYVIYGQASPSNVDLAALGSRGFRIDGADAFDSSGWSVAGAGDVNGDGLADVIVGAPYADPSSRLGAGSSYVIYGQASASDVDLAALGSRGFRIDGAAASDGSGWSVAGAGDVNGDGRADVIVGASGASPSSRSGAGSSYVIYGQASPSNVDLAALGSRGFRIDGAAAFDNSGTAVAGAGDVNGDGRADVIVGAPSADTSSGADAGSSYVIYGQASPSNVDLAALGSRGFRIDGAAAGDFSGTAVAGAGDVNGDGRADVIVGAPSADPSSRSLAGSSYVIYGQASPSNVDLAALGSRGFRIDGAAANGQSGYSVAGAGDVNGDGRADVIVGAPSASPSSRSGAGSSYVIYGEASPSNVDLATLGSRGFRIDGAAASDQSGYSVAGAGDVNGDGRPDVIVGAYYASPSSRSLAGSSYVIYGFGPASVVYPGPVAGTPGAPIADLVPTVKRTGTASFSVSPGLPAGLSLNSATGVISGTPATASSGTVTVTMTDLSGTATTTVPVTVATRDASAATLTATVLPQRRRLVSGQRMRIGIRAANTGMATASKATSCVTLPMNLAVISAGSAVRSGRTLCFRLGDIAPRSTATRTLRVRAVTARKVTRSITGTARATGVTRAVAPRVAVTIAPRRARTVVTG